MKKVTNVTNRSIVINRIEIPPKETYKWLDKEITFELNRKLWKLKNLGMIQIQEVIEEEIIAEEEVIEESKPKKQTRKRNSRKKGE